MFCTSISPDETDAPLRVHADAVLAPPIARQLLEPVARRSVCLLPNDLMTHQQYNATRQ
jgi:hypothetical protein